MEYSKKNVPQQKYENFGIWNIPRIFQKNSTTTKISKILEYGIFHGIFLEYSKKSTTTLGGVKFNQDFYRKKKSMYLAVTSTLIDMNGFAEFLFNYFVL